MDPRPVARLRGWRDGFRRPRDLRSLPHPTLPRRPGSDPWNPSTAPIPQRAGAALGASVVAFLWAVGNPVLTGEPARVRRTTRECALARNRLVPALATKIRVPYAAPGSGLAELLAAWKASQTDRTEPPRRGAPDGSRHGPEGELEGA